MWPAGSPDGQWIAYADDREGQFSVYVRQTSGAVIRQVPYSGPAGHPVWSSDGTTLYFKTNTGLMEASFSPSDGRIESPRPTVEWPSLYAGRPTPGNDYLRDYDVGPDGRILTTRELTLIEGSDVGHVVVVHDWFDELARRIDAAPGR